MFQSKPAADFKKTNTIWEKVISRWDWTSLGSVHWHNIEIISIHQDINVQ